MSKIVVPDGMYLAAMKHQDSGIQCSASLEAALLWLSENPVVPTLDQAISVASSIEPGRSADSLSVQCYAEWQRRMFLAPDPDDPIKDILYDESQVDHCGQVAVRPSRLNECLREAYRRGKESK